MNIRDPVHSDIRINDTEKALLDDPNFQRLRRVKQLGLADLVYPGANHTRFEHSLGTMQITRELSESVLGKENEELICTGLLHDVGHGAFSHQSDDLLKKHLKTTHEELGIRMLSDTSLKDVIQASALSYQKMLSYMKGDEEGVLVTGVIGSDRIDYLNRDAHYTGVAYGIIDYPRIRLKLTLSNGKLAVYNDGLTGAETLLLARYFMFSSVYHHKTILIAGGMYETALDIAIEEKRIPAEALKSFNDDQMLGAIIAGGGRPASMISNMLARRLFKKVCYTGIGKDVRIEEVADKLSKAGLSREDFLARTIEFKPSGHDLQVVAKDGSKVGTLYELSPLVTTLEGMIGSRRRLLVACESKNMEKAANAIKEFL
jgi:hypothetical protein